MAQVFKPEKWHTMPSGDAAPASGGGGGDPPNLLVHRVDQLEKKLEKIEAALKEIRDGQHAFNLTSAQQTGSINTQFADINGKLTTLLESNTSLRRDVEKLPTEYGVAKILVFVVGGLAAAASLLKVAWPTISKLLGP